MEIEYNKKLAKITRCDFSFRDTNKILILNIDVDYDEFGSQNICGLVLDNYNEDKRERVETAFGCELIRRIIDTFNCDNLKDIIGKVIYVLGEVDGLRFKPKGFKRPSFDNGKKIIYDDILKEFTNAKTNSK